MVLRNIRDSMAVWLWSYRELTYLELREISKK